MLALRWSWIIFGLITQILFVLLVVSLMWFMQIGASMTVADAEATNDYRALPLLINCGLIVIFASSHSALLVPSVRQTIIRYIPSQLYGCCFCLETCLCLWALMYWWHPMPGVIYQLTDNAWWIMMFSAAGAWILLAYSMWITGLGYQTGFAGLRAYWRPSSVAPRGFAPRGLYRLFRHPIYLSFLLIAWLTPVMTTGHLLLSVLMTIYLFLGSWLKDRRLITLIGEPYRTYMATVPGYPGFYWGPLGRRRQSLID